MCRPPVVYVYTLGLRLLSNKLQVPSSRVGYRRVPVWNFKVYLFPKYNKFTFGQFVTRNMHTFHHTGGSNGKPFVISALKKISKDIGCATFNQKISTFFLSSELYTEHLLHFSFSLRFPHTPSMMAPTNLRGNILFLFLHCFLVNTLKYMKGYASKL